MDEKTNYMMPRSLVAEEETEKKKPSILVVEDSLSDLGLLRRLLINGGYFVGSVSDGPNVFTSVARNRPDLILLDIQLPGMSGLEVCRRLKENDRTSDIPIIFISTLEDINEKIKAFSAGGVDYINKPIQSAEVLARVKTHLSIRNLQKKLADQNILLRKEVEERREIENALRKSQVNLAKAQEIAHIGSWEWNFQTNEIFWSREIYQIFGLDPFQFSPGIDTVAQKIHPEDRADNKTQIATVIKKRQPATFEQRIYRPDGSLRYLQIHCRISDDRDSNDSTIVGTAQDITDQKLGEIEIQKAKKKAEDANLAKSEFLANISHEIRTPLNAIMGFCEILLEKNVNAQFANYLNGIHTSGKALLNLINDILDLSKIESGRLKIMCRPMDLKDMIKEVYQLFLYKSREKNIDLALKLGNRFPDKIFMDEERIRQILMNLIGNAIKFTEKGYVTISLNCSPSMSQGKMDIMVEVEDTGIGIPEKVQSVIFDSFRQREGQTNRKYGGTGLGLALTKRLVEMLNGEVSVTSQLGKGSVFRAMFKDVQVADNDQATDPLSTPEIKPVSPSSTDDRLPGEVRIRLPELIKELNETLMPKWVELEELFFIDDVERFSADLDAIASKYPYPPLTSYNRDLVKHVSNNNIDGIESLLSRFPDLVDQIKTDVRSPQK